MRERWSPAARSGRVRRPRGCPESRLVVVLVLGTAEVAGAAAPNLASCRPEAAAPAVDTVFSQNRFPLRPTSDFEGASGLARLTPIWSPFGVALSPNGRFRYRLELTVDGLPQADSVGGDGYVAWLTDPTLTLVRRLGETGSGRPLVAEVDWNKFMVVVSVEGPETGPRWSGAIVLVGRSRSAQMRSLVGHSVFNRPEF